MSWGFSRKFYAKLLIEKLGNELKNIYGDEL